MSMSDNEINAYARSIRQMAGLPVSPIVEASGPPLTNGQRVIGALVRRLGGSVVLSPDELESVQGMILQVDPDGVGIEAQT